MEVLNTLALLYTVLHKIEKFVFVIEKLHCISNGGEVNILREKVLLKTSFTTYNATTVSCQYNRGM